MALNWAMLGPDGAPVPLPRESTVLTIDSGAELTVSIPDAPPSGTASAGGSGGSKKLKEEGRAYLTDQRLVFVSKNLSTTAPLQSLSIPLTSILATKFEQPMLGANYLSIDVRPSPEGGLSDGTRLELRSKGGPLFQFVSVLEKTRERAIYMKRQMQEEQESLPAYASPSTLGVASGRPGGSSTPMDAPPGYDD
ncbi:unnamed protein product [Peniophora sp. CBMAI 1063]|nr:unnamed protein product [Peniophora sp. CBMAI 1063]